jgi:hypothetical protein
MNKLALTFAIGAATLLGASAVNAAPAQKQTQAPAAHSDTATQATDMSSRHRRWHHRHHHHRWHHRHHRHWGYAPYPRSYGYYPSYYRPAPVISFGFGGFGGGRHWGHHHHRHW